MDDPSISNIVAPSSGVHITLPAFMGPKQMGLLDPVRLADGLAHPLRRLR
jgi:hypothetical protein